jgi:REP element-mobilizing transposase RayT
MLSSAAFHSFVGFLGANCELRHDNFIPNVEIHTRGRLPHWQVDNTAYFITFRLRDSLPREVVRELLLERDRMLATISDTVDRARLDGAFAIRLDRELDQHHGACLLRQHGDVVADALRHFNGSRYVLHSWCVMPNHVHVLLHVDRGREVPAILHSWKSFTAHAIGRGVIWQREYFDRVIRSRREFSDTVAYIRNNPTKAGLEDWPWVG